MPIPKSHERRGKNMLQELVIQNFAIIHELSLSFHEGMIVLTGETGAGKSIIIDAVGLLAGGRGSNEFVRHGEKKCVLEALFKFDQNEETIQVLNELGIEAEEGSIILQREIHTSGRNVCRANGTLVTTAALRKIGETLIDIHGQNEHQELMQADKHIGFLDQYAGQTLMHEKKAYQDTYYQYKKVDKELRQWEQNEKELAQRQDMLRFQVEEIGAAELIQGEEETLQEEKVGLVNYQKIMEALNYTYQVLQGEDSNGLDSIGAAMEEMMSIKDLDDDYAQLTDTISNSYYQLQEVVSDLSRKMDTLAYDEERLNEIESRLDVIHQLKRKYGENIGEILVYFEAAQEELATIEDREGQLERLTKEVSVLSHALLETGTRLTEKRKVAAKKLEKAIQDQLKELYMEKVQMVVRFKDIPTDSLIDKATENGLDHIEFFISTNPGEPPKPLIRVASGGELSRMMLAMKTIFSKTQGVTSIIFDEIDTGVSGRVAQAIANKMYSVSLHSQVLCITHLPQVAAMADHHYYISKETKNERTETDVSLLNKQEEVTEVARMLAGSEITPLTLETAHELKKLSESYKITLGE